MKCERCKGTGSIYKESPKTKKSRKRICPDCNGLGSIIKSALTDADKIPEDGAVVVVKPEKDFGVSHDFLWKEKKRLKAFIKTRIRGVEKVFDKDGKPLGFEDLQKMRIEMDERNKNQDDPEKMEEMDDLVEQDNYLVVDIENMEVPNHKNRGKGYMYKLLNNVKASYVRYINTSWTDSSPEGRKYLLRQGFEKQKTVLLWRNPKHVQQDGTLRTPQANQRDVPATEPAMAGSGGTRGSQDGKTADSGNKEADKISNS